VAWKRFGERVRACEFDLVHRITPLRPTTQSRIARKCTRASVPFVLGPLNGGVPWQRAFDSTRRQEREWPSGVRDAYKLLSRFSSMRQHAAAILVVSKDTLERVPARFQVRRAPRPLRCLFVGRFVPHKGAHTRSRQRRTCCTPAR